MKKVISILLGFLAICSMSTCAPKYGSPESNAESIDDPDCDVCSTAIVNGQSNFDHDSGINSNKQDEKYQFFLSCMNENPYDKWLKNELEKGERAEKTIYAEYLAFWKDEFAYTVESCETIFDDHEQYEQWKSNMQQWLVISQEILKTEMDIMYFSLGQLEVIVPYCKMIRQKTIDTKLFLYDYQLYHTLTPYTNIEISWCFQ